MPKLNQHSVTWSVVAHRIVSYPKRHQARSNKNDKSHLLLELLWMKKAIFQMIVMFLDTV